MLLDPDNIALVQDNRQMTYRELDKKANRIANYLLHGYGKEDGNIIAVLQEQSIWMIISILGILKAGFAFLPLDPSIPEQTLKSMIDDAQTKVIISDKNHIRLVNRLQWECESVTAFLCPDIYDIYEVEEECSGLLMDKKLWDYVGEEAAGPIGMGGWKSSFTGRLFSQDEIIEYRNNVRTKLAPYIHKNTRILEIGCSSGFTMFELAPLAGFYYGTDISDKILERTGKQACDDGYSNIRLKSLAAHEIDNLDEKDFDIIILNSVVQAFKGHNYLRQVIKKAVDLLKDAGVIFVGDVMDQSTKKALIEALKSFEKDMRGSGYITKTAFPDELFLDKRFIRDLMVEQPGIKSCEFSKKLHTIKNEMTEYRYDAILFIDKNDKGTSGDKRIKEKSQHGSSELEKYPDTGAYYIHKPANTAYVIFTSGSTGRPKGVVVSHKALLNMCNWYVKCHSITSEDRTTKFAGCGFDASIMEIFPILIKGGSIHILSQEVKSDLSRLNRYLEDNGITVCFLPTQYCEQFMELDNNSLRILNTGGEKLKKYIRRNYTLVDNYGPTECTVVSTWHIVDRQTANIPIGKPVDNTRIYILDGQQRPVPEGEAGEIHIAGENLADGYLGRPGLTHEKFVEDPFHNGERMYKTGDMARMLPDGNLEFLGRMDGQIKIRGYRIEPGEIESRLLEYPGIKEAVVTAYEDRVGEKSLCAYIAAGGDIPVSDIREYLLALVPQYMIPERYCFLNTLPRTPSGKVDRMALPVPDDSTESAANPIPPENRTQRKLYEIWQEVLGIRETGIYDSFFELGGNSLRVLKAALLINREFDVELTASMLFKAPTIKEQAVLVENTANTLHVPVPITGRKEFYPASAVQKGIYAIQQMNPSNTAYNIPYMFSVKGDISLYKLQRAFEEVVKKHEMLRTGFTVFEGLVVQRIEERPEISIEYCELYGQIEDLAVETFIKPFDLSAAPLVRLHVIKTGDRDYLLFMDIHHIIMDGSSMEILLNELSKAYNGGDIGGLKVRYRDYTGWQQAMHDKGALTNQREYWLGILSGELPVSSLPLDYKRPHERSYEGDVIRFEIDSVLTSRLTETAKRYDVSMNMLLLSIYKILLSKYCNSGDIIVGTPVYGRRHADFGDIIGMFANTLALRSHPKGSKRFDTYLAEVRDVVINAIDNQDYPFEYLLDNLEARYDKSRNPLFDTMFVMQKFEDKALLFDGLYTKRLNVSNKKAKFDMTWFAALEDGKICFEVEYCTRLFKRDTVSRAAGHYMKIAWEITEEPTRLISEIEIITVAEKRLILDNYCGSKACSDSRETVNGLFSKAAAKYGDKTALVFDGRAMSYSELDKRANQVAAHLIKKGVGRENRVALIACRSFEMVIGLLGILKAGGAVIPINPSYPSEYINEILKDSGTRLVLKHQDVDCGDNTAMAWESNRCEVVEIDGKEVWKESCAFIKPINEPDDLLYIIYTSGTTGKPKGVMLEHLNLLNLIDYQKNEAGIDMEGVLQFASIGFDVSLQEIFSCLLSGGRLLLIHERERTDIHKLLGRIKRERLTTLFLPPAFLELIFNEQEYIKAFPRSVRHIVSAGDRLHVPEGLKAYLKKTGIMLHNHYGPSETHVVTASSIDPAREIPDNPSIGRPITGRTIYIMDNGLKLMPPGIPGELYIGGESIGRGYYGNSRLTEEKFIQDPFNSTRKLYKSGDMARWLSDGSIEFLGRVDGQVKIRGYRIEPAEIERALTGHEGVKKAAVLAFDNKEGRYLCAYVTAGDGITEGQLKGFLSKRLPAFMIPSHFVFVQDIPLNFNGKVDRKALPEPHKAVGQVAGHNENGHPSNSTEKMLLDIWRDVLENSETGVNNDFFESGGHSLKAIRLMHRIKTVFKKELPFSTILNYPTVRGMAGLIQGGSFDKEWSHLVEIKRNEGAKNIFCVHPAPGTVICYNELAANMDISWSVYALQAKGLEKGQTPHKTLAGMAADYVKEIMGVQPKGPYNLLGWCIGGRIAYEMAQQLIEKGHEVELLAMLDTDPVFIRKPAILPKALPWFIYAAFSMLSHGRTVYKNFNITSFGPGSLFCRARTWSSLASAVIRYIPERYKGKGRVVLFQTEEGARMEEGIKDKSKSIVNFIDNLEIIHVEGKHISMMSIDWRGRIL